MYVTFRTTATNGHERECSWSTASIASDQRHEQWNNLTFAHSGTIVNDKGSDIFFVSHDYSKRGGEGDPIFLKTAKRPMIDEAT
eukprot:scaffold24657_cov38-Attheya_sp.AAC.1